MKFDSHLDDELHAGMNKVGARAVMLAEAKSPAESPAIDANILKLLGDKNA